jgi:hypothetical protein
MPRNRNTADVQALCIVSTLQGLNLLFFGLLFSYVKNEDIIPSSKFFYGGFIILFLILNFLRYRGVSNIKELAKRWRNEKVNQKFIGGFLLTIYIILSFVLAVGSSHYVGKYFRIH